MPNSCAARACVNRRAAISSLSRIASCTRSFRSSASGKPRSTSTSPLPTSTVSAFFFRIAHSRPFALPRLGGRWRSAVLDDAQGTPEVVHHIGGKRQQVSPSLMRAGSHPGLSGLFLVLYEHGGPCRLRGHRQTLFLQELDMLLHPPSCLVKAILDRMADSSEPIQIWGEESKEIGIVGGFDDQGVIEIEHRSSFYLALMPAVLRIAWQVPRGTSREPWKSTRIRRSK